jgi:hypothetical protein
MGFQKLISIMNGSTLKIRWTPHLDKTTKAYIFFIIIFIYIQVVQCLAPLSFLIDPCNEC